MPSALLKKLTKPTFCVMDMCIPLIIAAIVVVLAYMYHGKVRGFLADQGIEMYGASVKAVKNTGNAKFTLGRGDQKNQGNAKFTLGKRGNDEDKGNAKFTLGRGHQKKDGSAY